MVLLTGTDYCMSVTFVYKSCAFGQWRHLEHKTLTIDLDCTVFVELKMKINN
jgi:hypothetical protein